GIARFLRSCSTPLPVLRRSVDRAYGKGARRHLAVPARRPPKRAQMLEREAELHRIPAHTNLLSRLSTGSAPLESARADPAWCCSCVGIEVTAEPIPEQRFLHGDLQSVDGCDEQHCGEQCHGRPAQPP